MTVEHHSEHAIQTPTGGLDPMIVTFTVTDPEVLLALGDHAEGPDRSQYMTTALKVGVLALKAAKGTIDSAAVRHEGDRLMNELGARLNTWRSAFEERVSGELSRYFDPKSGVFTDRVDRLTRSDGELTLVMQRSVTDAQGQMTRMFESFIGENSDIVKLLDPTGNNQLVTTFRTTLDEVVTNQNAAMSRQFSLDHKDGALCRFLAELAQKHGDIHMALVTRLEAVVAEFSLDSDDTALSRLVARVEGSHKRVTDELSLDKEGSALQRLRRMLDENALTTARTLQEMKGTLETVLSGLQIRKDEAARSTRHGIEFEQALSNHLRVQAEAAGDVFHDTGATTGMIPNCKVGDHVLTFGPDKVAAGAKIVVEAKESASYDLARTLDEADTARRNRQATVCVFVHSVKTAQPSIPVFQRYGHDIVVQWDSEDDSKDAYLKAAMMVATALSVRASTHGKADAASFATVDRAIEKVRKALDAFDEINTSAESAKRAAEKILDRTRITQKTLIDQVTVICDEFMKLREGAADE